MKLFKAERAFNFRSLSIQLSKQLECELETNDHLNQTFFATFDAPIYIRKSFEFGSFSIQLLLEDSQSWTNREFIHCLSKHTSIIYLQKNLLNCVGTELRTQ